MTKSASTKWEIFKIYLMYMQERIGKTYPIAWTGSTFSMREHSQNGTMRLMSCLEANQLLNCGSIRRISAFLTKATLKPKTSIFQSSFRDRMVFYPFINFMRTHPAYVKIGPLRLLQVEAKTDGKPLEVHLSFRTFIKGEVNIYGFILSKSSDWHTYEVTYF